MRAALLSEPTRLRYCGDRWRAFSTSATLAASVQFTKVTVVTMVVVGVTTRH